MNSEAVDRLREIIEELYSKGAENGGHFASLSLEGSTLLVLLRDNHRQLFVDRKLAHDASLGMEVPFFSFFFFSSFFPFCFPIGSVTE